MIMEPPDDPIPFPKMAARRIACRVCNRTLRSGAEPASLITCLECSSPQNDPGDEDDGPMEAA